MKTFYLQTDNVNRITDVIEYEHEGYNPVELDTPLPPNILSGAYELISGSAVYRKEWDKSEDKQRLADLETAYAELMFGGAK